MSFLCLRTCPARASRRSLGCTGIRGRSPRQFHASRPATERSFPAVFARGGTSNGLLIQRRHLPSEEEWHAILPAAMGSPDPSGRQLNGMGSGVSSTSKICILAPTSRPDADVEFTFVQVGIRDGCLDTAGNCGNMSTIVGPVSLEEGLVPTPTIEEPSGGGGGGGRDGTRTALVRVFNTNTQKLMHARFAVTGNPPRYCPAGDYAMAGVPGRGSRIRLSFLYPAGAKTGRALPTGRSVDTLTLPDGSSIQASLVDVSNPGVFVRVADLGFADAEALGPAVVEADAALKTRLEQIRRAGAAVMGLDPAVESVPKIVLIFPRLARSAAGVDVRCLALSMGQVHKAVPLTLALCLGSAVQMVGTIPNQLAAVDASPGGGTVSIGHPSGRVDVGTVVEDGMIMSAELYGTGRVLMRGEVFY